MGLFFNRHECNYELVLARQNASTQPIYDDEKEVIVVIQGDLYHKVCTECRRIKFNSEQWDGRRLEFEPDNIEEVSLDE